MNRNIICVDFVQVRFSARRYWESALARERGAAREQKLKAAVACEEGRAAWL